jgi:hypothetical protein
LALSVEEKPAPRAAYIYSTVAALFAAPKYSAAVGDTLIRCGQQRDGYSYLTFNKSNLFVVITTKLSACCGVVELSIDL